MKWEKKGLIYTPAGKHGFDVSHCHKPTPLLIDDETLRIYFGTRDEKGKTRTTFVDLDTENLSRVKYIHDRPVLDLGKIGSFDDSGVNVSSVVRKGNCIYMYVIGWNPSTTVHTRNSIGIAISEDNGLTFSHMYDGPILDRCKDEPYYTGAVDVIYNEDIDLWQMWYTSKYATSKNGVDWIRDNISCIKPLTPIEATARPCVIMERNKGLTKYRMWYSRRDIVDFRTDKNHGYRAGYAESLNGIDWIRMDSEANIAPSLDGWDSEAIAYPYVIKLKGEYIMFYNGNSFGKEGFGYAIGVK